MGEIKRIAIIGAGSLGVMYGHLFSRIPELEPVRFIADRARSERYRFQGVYCNGERCDFEYLDEPATEEPFDLILFAVKYPAIRQAIAQAKFFAGPQTILLSVLNGIESERIIAEQMGEEHLLYCMVYGMSVSRDSEGVRYSNPGCVAVGTRDNRMTDDLQAVTRLLEQAEIPFEVPRSILHRMWSKLMLNTGGNQVAAVHGVGFGALQQEGPLRQMVIDTMHEVQRIAASEGIILPNSEITRWMEVMDTLDPEGAPSMAQDVAAGKKTEVELFAGAMRRLGKKHGIPTPLNDALYIKIKALEDAGC